MQRLVLSAADCEWLVARAKVGDPLRLELIALAVRGGADGGVLDVRRAALDALDGVLLDSGDVYRAKLSDGRSVSTLAVKIWTALLNEREDEIAPLWRAGFEEGQDAREAGDADGGAAKDDAERAAAVRS